MSASIRQARVSGASGGVLVVGDIMMDIIVKPDGPVVRGSDRSATIRTLPGGSAANQAAWLGHQGVPTVLVAKVADADLAIFETMMRGFGVTPKLRGDADLATGCLVTLLDPDGQRSFLTDRGANAALDRDDLPDALLDGIDVLHISGYALFVERPRLAVLDLAHRAERRGIPMTVDPGSASFLAEIGPESFLDWTRGAAICFPNDDEAATLTGSDDEAEQRRVLSATYPLTVMKHGSRGAEIIGEGGRRLLSLPAPSVEVVDTTGAGDAFLAGYLAASLGGASLEECLRRAIGAGSLATTMFGGRPARP